MGNLAAKFLSLWLNTRKSIALDAARAAFLSQDSSQKHGRLAVVAEKPVHTKPNPKLPQNVL
jgi:hypothetical protein